MPSIKTASQSHPHFLANTLPNLACPLLPSIPVLSSLSLLLVQEEGAGWEGWDVEKGISKNQPGYVFPPLWADYVFSILPVLRESWEPFVFTPCCVHSPPGGRREHSSTEQPHTHSQSCSLNPRQSRFLCVPGGWSAVRWMVCLPLYAHTQPGRNSTSWMAATPALAASSTWQKIPCPPSLILSASPSQLASFSAGPSPGRSGEEEEEERGV